MEIGSHVNTLSLFHRPNKWPPAYLSKVHIEEHDHADGVTIIGDEQLPKNDDPWFVPLAADFARPTKEEIPLINIKIKDTRFWESFDSIREARELSRDGASIQPMLDRMASEIVCRSGNKPLFPSSGCRQIPFSLDSLKVRGKLTGVGTYVWDKDLNMPLTIFVSTTGQGQLCPAERIVPYILLQAILKYERNPSIDSHTVFVVSMKGTNLQFNKGVASQQYLKDLICQRVPADPLVLYRTQPYDLFEQNDRKECLRVFLGLIRRLNLECA